MIFTLRRKAVTGPAAASVAELGAVACSTCGAPVTLAFCAQCGTARPPDAKAAHSHLCRNCGHEADDAFCPHCGQETRIALPTAREFMRDAAGRFVALDGRLWRTLALLLTRPGFLTNAYLAGRRLRYVRPARLFLFTSIIAFALVRFVGQPELLGIGDKQPDNDIAAVHKTPAAKAAKQSDAGTVLPGSKGSAANQEGASSKGSAAGKAREGNGSDATVPVAKADKPVVELGIDTDDDTTLLSSDGLKLGFDKDADFVVGGNSPIVKPLRQRVDAYNQLSLEERKKELTASAFRYGPYAAFALLPAFAFMLQLLYAFPSRRFPHRPRRFAAHLVFGAHNHAFLFVLICVLAVLPHFGGRNFIAGSFACTYFLLSLRRVYGGSWIGICVRAAVIGTVYSVMFAVAVALLLVVAVLLR